jgi:hypothetical protein
MDEVILEFEIERRQFSYAPAMRQIVNHEGRELRKGLKYTLTSHVAKIHSPRLVPRSTDRIYCDCGGEVDGK